MEYAYVNGAIVPAHKAMISVFDRGLVLGDGLFETLRAVEGHPQFFNLHYSRLAKSARRLRIPLPESERDIRTLVIKLCRKSGLDDAVVRITLTRGDYQGGLSIDPNVKPSLIITVKDVAGLSGSIYAKGVKVAISSINKAAASGLDSKIKSTNYLANIFAKAEADRKGCYESILLGPNGEIAELSTASFFCVMDDTVLTAPIATGILPGITRQVTIRILRHHGIPFQETAIFPSQVKDMEEAFLCSSVRGLVPIWKIEKEKIGNGKVGPVFRRLNALYQEECEKEKEKDAVRSA